MRRLLTTVAVAICALVGVAGDQQARSGVEGWREIAWPFPRDGWPAGRAFRCATEACGGEVEVYVRPKLGFCNCDSGVADDDEVDRVADLDLMSERFVPLEPGKVIRLADMAGRVRAYDLKCPTARATPPSASRCRTAATCWSRWRKAGHRIGSPARGAGVSGLRRHDALDDGGDGRKLSAIPLPSPLEGEGGTSARSAFVTGEGSLSADTDPSSVADFVRATFSHKGRREGGA